MNHKHKESERGLQFGIVVDFELLLAPSGWVCDVELKQNETKKEKWLCKNRRKLGFHREREI